MAQHIIPILLLMIIIMMMIMIVIIVTIVIIINSMHLDLGVESLNLKVCESNI